MAKRFDGWSKEFKVCEGVVEGYAEGEESMVER
jgi:hypothetical protein